MKKINFKAANEGLTRSEMRSIMGGSGSSSGACILSAPNCPDKRKRYVNSPDNDGFECCKP